jgi:hypothetical protein
VIDLDGDNTTIEFTSGFDSSFMIFDELTSMITFQDIKKENEGSHSIQVEIRDSAGFATEYTYNINITYSAPEEPVIEEV